MCQFPNSPWFYNFVSVPRLRFCLCKGREKPTGAIQSFVVMSSIPFQFSHDLTLPQRFLFGAKIGFVSQQFYYDTTVDSPAAQELYGVFTPLTRGDLMLKQAKHAKKLAVHIETDLGLDSETLCKDRLYDGVDPQELDRLLMPPPRTPLLNKAGASPVGP